MSNAKYLAFDTPNTKNQPSSDISNLKIFDTWLQYRLIFETVRTNVPKLLLLFYMLFLSPPQTYLSLRLVLSLHLVLFLNSHLCRISLSSVILKRKCKLNVSLKNKTQKLSKDHSKTKPPINFALLIFLIPHLSSALPLNLRSL